MPHQTVLSRRRITTCQPTFSAYRLKVALLREHNPHRLGRASRSQHFKTRRQFPMNRRYGAFLIGSVLSLAALLGLAWAASVEDELKKFEKDRAAATVKGDVATLEKQTSDDYTFINFNGKMVDKSQMIDNFKTGRTKLTSNDVSDMKVRVYGNTAVMTGKADLAGMIEGKETKQQVMFTRVFVKKGGGWQTVSLQQTLVGQE
jgi:ketosteroid isomerase-like protein